MATLLHLALGAQPVGPTTTFNSSAAAVHHDHHSMGALGPAVQLGPSKSGAIALDASRLLSAMSGLIQQAPSSGGPLPSDQPQQHHDETSYADDSMSPALYADFEKVNVTCNGNTGIFLIRQQLLLCGCRACCPSGQLAQRWTKATPITPTEFERHSGLPTAKKWRTTIKVATDDVADDGGLPIGKYLEDHYNILPKPKTAAPTSHTSKPSQLQPQQAQQSRPAGLPQEGARQQTKALAQSISNAYMALTKSEPGGLGAHKPSPAAGGGALGSGASAFGSAARFGAPGNKPATSLLHAGLHSGTGRQGIQVRSVGRLSGHAAPSLQGRRAVHSPGHLAVRPSLGQHRQQPHQSQSAPKVQNWETTERGELQVTMHHNGVVFKGILAATGKVPAAAATPGHHHLLNKSPTFAAASPKPAVQMSPGSKLPDSPASQQHSMSMSMDDEELHAAANLVRLAQLSSNPIADSGAMHRDSSSGSALELGSAGRHVSGEVEPVQAATAFNDAACATAATASAGDGCCLLCHRAKDDQSDLPQDAIGAGNCVQPGTVIDVKSQSGEVRGWVHAHCAQWAPNVFSVNGNLFGVAPAVEQARGCMCERCHEGGATLRCQAPGCNQMFHLPCAWEAGCSLNVSKRAMFCMTHASSTTKTVKPAASPRPSTARPGPSASTGSHSQSQGEEHRTHGGQSRVHASPSVQNRSPTISSQGQQGAAIAQAVNGSIRATSLASMTPAALAKLLQAQQQQNVNAALQAAEQQQQQQARLQQLAALQAAGLPYRISGSGSGQQQQVAPAETSAAMDLSSMSTNRLLATLAGIKRQQAQLADSLSLSLPGDVPASKRRAPSPPAYLTSAPLQLQQLSSQSQEMKLEIPLHASSINTVSANGLPVRLNLGSLGLTGNVAAVGQGSSLAKQLPATSSSVNQQGGLVYVVLNNQQ